MRTVEFQVVCKATYRSELEIPSHIKDQNDVLQYIQNHLDKANISDLEFLQDLEGDEAVELNDISF